MMSDDRASFADTKRGGRRIHLIEFCLRAFFAFVLAFASKVRHHPSNGVNRNGPNRDPGGGWGRHRKFAIANDTDGPS
jgi:hypothetical protein